MTIALCSDFTCAVYLQVLVSYTAKLTLEKIQIVGLKFILMHNVLFLEFISVSYSLGGRCAISMLQISTVRDAFLRSSVRSLLTCFYFAE